MEFTVDPEALVAFAGQLDRYEQCTAVINRFIDDHEAHDTFAQVGAQGLFGYVLARHSDCVAQAKERVSTAGRVGAFASMGMRQAARYYQDTDAAAAARVDAIYPAVPAGTGRAPGGADSVLSFADMMDPTAHLCEPDGGDLAPKAASIVSGIGVIADWTSMSWWGRQVLLEVYGRDPFTDALEFLSGDWQAIAAYADGWRQCGTALDRMARTISDADEALWTVWRGNAADAAIAWVQRFTAVTFDEAAYFEYLIEVYRQHLEIAFWVYESLNYLLGQLLDILTQLAAVIVSTPTGIGPLFVGIWAILDAIAFVIDTARQPYRWYKASEAALSSPPAEPPSTMAALITNTDGPASYRHPAVGLR